MTPAAAPAIHLTDVTFRYGADVLALDAVNLSVTPGESVAVVGPSGSGKSTFLHCCSGLLQPESGTAMVGATDMAKATTAVRRRVRLRQIGIVLQDGQLLPELDVLDNIALPGRLRGLSKRAAVVPAAELLEVLGLAGLEHRALSELSGGQYQRVAVARALAFRPAVVLADEPTGALDAVNRVRVFDLLLQASSDRLAATIVVTHDLALAERCSRQVELVDGRLTSV